MDELAKAQNALANAQKSGAPEDEIRDLELYVADLQSAKKDGKNANVTVEGISPEQINLMYGAAPGAVLGQPVGKFVEDVFEGTKQAAQTRQNVVPEIPANAQGVPKSRVDRILYGTLEDGSSSLARQEGQHILQQQLAERVEEGKKTVQQLAKQGIRGIDPNIIAKSPNLVPTNRGILTTVEQAEALEKPGTSLASKAKNIGTGAKDILKGVQYASNKGWGPVIGRTLGGIGVGTGIVDTINRIKEKDPAGAIISGIGTLGSGLSFVPGLGLIGAGVAVGAPALNYLLDENAKGNLGQGTQQSYQNINPAGDVYATGGLVHLADGGLPDINISGQSIPNMSGKMPGVGYMPTPQGAMIRMQLEQELANRARLRAAATGTGAAIPGQQSIKMMPGNLEAGVNIPVGSGNVDISGYRSINPMNTPISGGHMYGGNVRYTLPFSEGGDVKKPKANEGGAFIGYPQINRNRQVGSGTGFLDALVGAPPSRENILNPSDYSYMEGYEKGEPYGIAAMALPFAGALKPASKVAKYHPLVEKGLAEGRIHPNDAQWMSDYAHTPGQALVETGTGAFKDQSEKMQNFVQRMQKGEIEIPNHWQGPGGINVGGGQFDSGDVNRTSNIGYAGGGRVGALTELFNLIKQSGGSAAATRLERAADLIPNLEHQYQPQALKHAFTGDNAQAVMVMNPKDFEKYAAPIDTGYKSSVMQTYGIGDPEKYGGYNNMPKGTYQNYIDYLGQFTRPGGGGISDVPYLQLGQELNSSFPAVLGHEGRHRTAALEKLGDQSTLVRMMPRAALREPFPRRSQEEYLKALTEQIGQKPFVKPQKYMNDQGKDVRRDLIELPELFKKGGDV